MSWVDWFFLCAGLLVIVLAFLELEDRWPFA